MSQNQKIICPPASPSGVEKALLQHLEWGGSSLLDRVRISNNILLHNYQVSVNKQLHCPLEGCQNSFEIALIPGQIIYPKFCPEHRTPHRRQQFVRNQSYT